MKRARRTASVITEMLYESMLDLAGSSVVLSCGGPKILLLYFL